MFKRIIKSIFNQFSKTLLLFLILTALFLCLFTSFIMKDSTSTIINQIYKTIRPEITLDSSITVLDWNEYAVPSLKDKDVYGDNDKINNYLETYYNDIKTLSDSPLVLYSDINMIVSNKLLLAPYSCGGDLLLVNNNSYISKDNASFFYNEFINQSFFYYPHLVSTKRSDYSFDYYNDVGKLIDGRNFTDKEIEDGAFKIILFGMPTIYDGNTIREINVGDTITYSLCKKGERKINYDNDGNIIDISSDETLEVLLSFDFEVIGISDYNLTYDNDIFCFNLIPENTLIKILEESYPYIEEYSLLNSEYVNSSIVNFIPITFTLNSFDDLEDFIDEINELNNLGRNYTYSTTADKYISFVSSVEGVKEIFNIVYVFSLIASCLILFFIITLEINNRQKEIGILSTLGEKKRSICLQFIIEYLIIILISFIFALFISIIISNKLINNLLDFNEIVALKDVFDNYENISNLSFNLSYKEVFSLIVIVVFIFIPTIISSLFYILKLNPKDVLLEKGR